MLLYIYIHLFYFIFLNIYFNLSRNRFFSSPYFPYSKPQSFLSRPCITPFIINSLAVGFSFCLSFIFVWSFIHCSIVPSPLPFLLFFLLIFLRLSPLHSLCFAISLRSTPWPHSHLPPRLYPGVWPLSSDPWSDPCWVADASLTHLPLLGVCNDHGKTYALYTLTVFRKNPDGSEDTWKTYRRYSDFHDFHMRITEQVKLFQGFSFNLTFIKLNGTSHSILWF